MCGLPLPSPPAQDTNSASYSARTLNTSSSGVEVPGAPLAAFRWKSFPLVDCAVSGRLGIAGLTPAMAIDAGANSGQ